MIRNQYNITLDTKRGLVKQDIIELKGSTNNAYIFAIDVIDDDKKVDLEGKTAILYVKHSYCNTIPIRGSVHGNYATFALPQKAYVVNGTYRYELEIIDSAGEVVLAIAGNQYKVSEALSQMPLDTSEDVDNPLDITIDLKIDAHNQSADSHVDIRTAVFNLEKLKHWTEDEILQLITSNQQDLSALATKLELTEAIKQHNIDIKHVTSQEIQEIVDTAISKIHKPPLVDIEGAITQHKQDTKHYTEQEIIALILANTGGSGGDVDLTGYVTTEALTTKLAEYYTKRKTDELFALKTEIPVVPDISGLATKKELESYAKKSEIPSIEGLATETYVNNTLSTELDIILNALQ